MVMDPEHSGSPFELRSGPDGDPLVSTSISQQDSFEIYRTSIRVKRSGCGNHNQKPPKRTAINSFSSKSRSRLRFHAINSTKPLISQFLLTYHDDWPTDGRECKKHLNAWLTHLRRLVPGIGYLWILEFQGKNGRTAPHFHVYLTIPPDRDLRMEMAKSWCRIAVPDDDQALLFHSHHKNWINWQMHSGGYICKYLDKEHQKLVPDGYVDFGRFWANSRNIKPDPISSIPPSDLDQLQEIDEKTGEVYGGEKFIIRTLGRCAEKQTNGYSRFRTRAPIGSYTMLQCTKVFLKIQEYFRYRQSSEPSDSFHIFVDKVKRIQRGSRSPTPISDVLASMGSIGNSR